MAMTDCESMLKELEEKATKLASAKKAATAPGATEREVSDCKIIEQEFMGMCRRTRDMVEKEGSARDKETMARLAQ